MTPMMAPLAGPLGEVVLQGRKGRMRVPDIAARLFGIEIGRQNPNAHVTGLDGALVSRVALGDVRKVGVSSATTCWREARSTWNLLTSTGAGDAYTSKESAEMHRKAGFGEATSISIPNSPHTIVTARA